MSTDKAIQQLHQTLASSSEEAKIEAVLALSDDATLATATLEAALDAATPRLQVALLDTLFRFQKDPKIEQKLITLLDSDEAQGDDGEELYMMARIALNRAEGDEQDAFSLIQDEREAGTSFDVLGVDSDTGKLAVIVHGTWAKDGKWWRSGGDFHTYLRVTLGMDYLYDDEDPFVWSGRNRDGDRAAAADSFAHWAWSQGAEELEVYAHSHGANVAMFATKQNLKIDKLVMLSPPVRSDYFADWTKVVEAFNIQARFDPVVAIARGGQRFNLGDQVKELTLDVRGHSMTHDPQVWEDHRVPEFVGLR